MMGEVMSSYYGRVNVRALVPGRAIDGISAMLLPYTGDDRPDWHTFRALLDRTWTHGLTPAVNMDTGYVNLLSLAERDRVLAETSEVASGRRFVAGAFINDADGSPASAYREAVHQIRRHGGTPILFQASALKTSSEAETLAVYRTVADMGGPILAFELGTMFAEFGRIYSPDFFCRLLDMEAFTGLKHSSLDRACEWERLDIRDRRRPEFRLYTGKDLAIDMVFYG